METKNDDWEKTLSCAMNCSNCGKKLGHRSHRVLSVYSHDPICMECKKEEEKKPDYADASKQFMASCIQRSGKPYGNPEGYCFHHFCPFTCKE